MRNKKKRPALVGIVPRKELWPLIQKERWYHIPVESAPQNIALIEYLAFYFPKVFGKEYQYKVVHFAKVLNIEIVKRIEFFPSEFNHKRAFDDYLRISIGNIQKLPKPIPSKRWRRIVHIPTSLEKLMTAEEINDLYDTSPLEEKVYREMKKRKIEAERQLHVEVNNQIYCLDFGIFCRDGNVDVECDGEKYHSLPKALAYDRQRNNQLTSYGWSVLRFTGREINNKLENCFEIIEKTINSLGGVNFDAVGLKQQYLIKNKFIW